MTSSSRKNVVQKKKIGKRDVVAVPEIFLSNDLGDGYHRKFQTNRVAIEFQMMVFLSPSLQGKIKEKTDRDTEMAQSVKNKSSIFLLRRYVQTNFFSF